MYADTRAFKVMCWMVVTGTTGPEMVPIFVMDLDVRLDLNKSLSLRTLFLSSPLGQGSLAELQVLGSRHSPPSGLLRDLAWNLLHLQWGPRGRISMVGGRLPAHVLRTMG